MNLLLLVDRSTSMALRDRDGAVKWERLVGGVEDLLRRDLPDVRLGLLLFPSPNEVLLEDGTCESPGCCVPRAPDELDVPLAPVAEVRLPILSALEVGPGGATPTASALEHAFDYFTEGAGAELRGAKLVLLVTDGGGNCNPEVDCEEGCLGTAKCTDTCTAAECDEDVEVPCVDEAATIAQIERLVDRVPGRTLRTPRRRR